MMGLLLKAVFAGVFAVVLGDCSAAEKKHDNFTYKKGAQEDRAIHRILHNPLLKDRILGLNPEEISEVDIRDILSQAPAPRIINLHGGLPTITMEPFARFLIAMGYPEEKLRNPESGDYSTGSFGSSKKLAGIVAWIYEREGMMPILIGQSQGGMMVIKVLHELAGGFHEKIPVWNPLSGEEEERYSIIDPLSGLERPVVGLRLEFASAIGTGRLMRLLLGQWDMLTRLRRIPDSVREFAGFQIRYDLIGGDLPGFNRYFPLGSAVVHNIELPAGFHGTTPLTEHLAENRATRDWINSYVPSKKETNKLPRFDVDTRNLLFAAEIWYRIKKYWCIELQQLIRAKEEKP
jgi:hypothetical protein